MREKLNAGVLQFDVQKGNIKANLETIEHGIEALSENRIRLAVLPEMFSCSFDNNHLPDHAQNTDEILKRLSAVAKKHEMAIAGSLPVAKNNHIYNTMVFIDRDGRVRGAYEKLHLFRLTREDRFYTAGSRICVMDTSLGRVGMMICYDLRFPEQARAMAVDNAELMLVSAQWPKTRVRHWKALLTARAIENQCYVIAANRIGREDELVFPGCSMIIDPWGNTAVQCDEHQVMAWGEIDMAKIGQARKTIPCMDDRRPDIYG